MTIKTELKKIAMTKANKSVCRYKISAIGFNFKGELIGTATNKPRFERVGGSIHAEMNLMSRYGTRIKKIVICRVSPSGELLPIHPCKTCKRKMDELGINCYTIGDLKEV